MKIETVQSSCGFGRVNRNRVPKRQWRKWSALGRAVFNETYGAMMANPEHYWHPMAQRVGKKLWKTTAWNAAWIAADAVKAILAADGKLLRRRIEMVA